MGCVVVGSSLDSIQPHFKLDVVLTPEELADKSTRDRTLEILDRGQRKDWPFWCLAGLAIIVVAAIGLYSQMKPRQKASPDER
jgi:hypothetical protein